MLTSFAQKKSQASLKVFSPLFSSFFLSVILKKTYCNKEIFPVFNKKLDFFFGHKGDTFLYQQPSSHQPSN